MVSGTAVCTATGTVGAECTGTEPGRGLGEAPAAEGSVFRKKQKSMFATSRRRDMASSSRALRSSGPLFKSALSKLFTLGGTTGGGCCGRNIQRVNVREGEVGQASGSWGAVGRSMGGGGRSRLRSRLEGVSIISSRSHHLPCGSEENGAGGLNVIGRRGADCPLVVKRVAQCLGIKPGDGRVEFDSSHQQRWEKSLSRKGVLGPRRGPRGCTTTMRGHSAVRFAVS